MTKFFKYSADARCGFYLVGLIDILGQKKKLLELDQIHTDDRDTFATQFIENW